MTLSFLCGGSGVCVDIVLHAVAEGLNFGLGEEKCDGAEGGEEEVAPVFDLFGGQLIICSGSRGGGAHEERKVMV
jgi:hypothetical protein